MTKPLPVWMADQVNPTGRVIRIGGRLGAADRRSLNRLVGSRVTRPPMTDGRHKTVGPLLWANWKSQERGLRIHESFEAEILTDANVHGEKIELGPYTVFNSIGSRIVGRLEPKLTVRVANCQPWATVPLENCGRTFTSHYVGTGTLADQLATLLSLALGARFRGGDHTRVWWDDHYDDPAGTPKRLVSRAPSMVFPDRESMLPDVFNREVALVDAIKLIALLPGLSAEEATEVMRAARMYRQALWIADDDAELAWLLLVSAIEVAAAQWRGSSGTPTQQLEQSLPDLTELLKSRGGGELVDEVAPMLAHLTGSTSKFQNFIATFGIEPPINRPSEAFQIDWSNIK